MRGIQGDLRIGILIQVRMKSSRLTRKAMIEIEEKPLIEHLVERMKLVRIPNIIVICTSQHPDDVILIDFARRIGVKWYAGSEEDVMDRFLQAAHQENLAVIVRATGDCPLNDPEYIERAISTLISSGADYVTVLGMPIGTGCEVFTTKALEKAYARAVDPSYGEYMSFYFRNNPDVFNIQEIQCDENVNRPHYRLTVDEAKDLELIREVFHRLYKRGQVFPLRSVIELLDGDPDLAAINRHIQLKYRDDESLVDALRKNTRLYPE